MIALIHKNHQKSSVAWRKDKENWDSLQDSSVKCQDIKKKNDTDPVKWACTGNAFSFKSVFVESCI